MDPNATLATLRADVQNALTDIAVNPLLREIAETFDNLDEWLSRGGFLPTAWER